ncbi:AraC family transcriptional regulator [Actinomycetospora endophytica]|uniref:AraC family transcriptional regulator n=1 Tax=Actinomycetospora endophytica TaxID=2291215 RepID=A0ABS8PBK6_9PSEU|nr:AraC family transcriptional regulator [Actinomycetospora endophytica]MCD2195666.1 AraC family transcriptional regulator [Actinomycetospora endophytica]
MDEIAGLLDGPRAHGAFLLRCVLEPPFAVRIEDEAPLTVVVVTRGATALCPAGQPGATYPAGPGDVIVVRGPEPYTVTDAGRDAPVQAVIGPDQGCWSPPGTARPPHELGVRSWGHAPDAATSMLVGTYPVGGEVGARLVRSLPEVTVLSPDDLGGASTGPLVGLLDAELDRDGAGQDVVLDRALDLLLATVLRAWFAGPAAPSAARARQDPAIGAALRAMEAEPGRGWTVAGLARGAGLSRAAFARRFADRVGEPPMAWLTDLRLSLAADLLRGTDLTVATIADRVGYASPFALSTAFLRERGVRPTALRAM